MLQIILGTMFIFLFLFCCYYYLNFLIKKEADDENKKNFDIMQKSWTFKIITFLGSPIYILVWFYEKLKYKLDHRK